MQNLEVFWHFKELQQLIHFHFRPHIWLDIWTIGFTNPFQILLKQDNSRFLTMLNPFQISMMLLQIQICMRHHMMQQQFIHFHFRPHIQLIHFHFRPKIQRLRFGICGPEVKILSGEVEKVDSFSFSAPYSVDSFSFSAQDSWAF